MSWRIIIAVFGVSGFAFGISFRDFFRQTLHHQFLIIELCWFSGPGAENHGDRQRRTEIDRDEFTSFFILFPLSISLPSHGTAEILPPDVDLLRN
jgi:hypothetical protein